MTKLFKYYSIIALALGVMLQTPPGRAGCSENVAVQSPEDREKKPRARNAARSKPVDKVIFRTGTLGNGQQ